MDVTTLTTLVMSFLTPLVTKAGEDAYSGAKELTKRIYDVVHARFTHEPDGGNAHQALQTFVGGDADFAGVVEKKLRTILQSDPAFVQQLSQVLQSAPRQLLVAAEEAQASHIRLKNTLGSGQQEINLQTRAKADDVQFTIGPETPNA